MDAGGLGGAVSTLRARASAALLGVAALNLAAWGWAAFAFRGYPLLFGTALIAYGFGLRHGFDADHIAAIDNVTRKLMQEGKRPVATGLWFSLGHSTVVLLASMAVALAARAMRAPLERLHGVGSAIGTLVSAAVLLGVAVMNTAVLLATWRAFQATRAGANASGDAALSAMLSGGGLLARLLRPLFAAITESWHLYPLGFLFGLGFDTATEVGLLGISATESARGLGPLHLLVFPILFTAGMALVDTADGLLMLGAYGWAFASPSRKLIYNLTVTFASVVAAVVVGGVELLGLVGERLHAGGPFWDAIARLDEHFGALGWLVVAAFALAWLVSAAAWRWRRARETPR